MKKNIISTKDPKNFSKSKKLTQEIVKLEILQKFKRLKFKIISSIPNIALDDVPLVLTKSQIK